MGIFTYTISTAIDTSKETMLSLKSLCSEVIVNDPDIEIGLPHLTLPRLLKENLTIYIQERKAIDKTRVAIMRESEVINVQMQRLNEILELFHRHDEIFGRRNEHFDLFLIREKFSVQIHCIVKQLINIDRDYSLVKINGIPCFYDEAGALLCIKRGCQHILCSIHQLQKDITDEFTDLRIMIRHYRDALQTLVST